MAEGKELMEWTPFQLMEKIEDEAILAEIKGEVLKDLVYSFTDSSGHKVEGLSKAGVDAVVADLARRGEAIRELDLDWREDETSYKAVVRAGRFAISRQGDDVLLDSTYGAKRQSKTLTTRDGKEIENPFAFELCIVKAARNAKRRLIPESLAVELIERARTEGKTRQVPPTYPPASSRTAPAKASPARAQAPVTETTAEENLKKLRQQVGIEASKVFKTEDERRAWQKTEYNVDSMTQLDEGQLKGMLALMKEKQTLKPTPSITDLGFSSVAEQTQMRKQLIDLLRELGYKTADELTAYRDKKGWMKTSEATKDELQSYIEEVEQEQASVKEAEDIPENI